MKNLLFGFVFMVMSLTGLSVAVSAQQGRPDPTGQGRYMQFGGERSFTAAKVIKELPAGTSCAPAGELVGIRLWNSTRNGMAILSDLTNKAEVAVTPNGEMFLCKCAGGYNQLFRLDYKGEQAQTQESASLAQQQAQAVNITNNIPQPKDGRDGKDGKDGVNGTNGKSCTIQQLPDKKGKMRDAVVCEDGTAALIPKQGGMSTTTKVVIGTTAAVATTTVILCVFLKKCGKAPRLGPVVTTLP